MNCLVVISFSSDTGKPCNEIFLRLYIKLLLTSCTWFPPLTGNKLCVFTITALDFSWLIKTLTLRRVVVRIKFQSFYQKTSPNNYLQNFNRCPKENFSALVNVNCLTSFQECSWAFISISISPHQPLWCHFQNISVYYQQRGS